MGLQSAFMRMESFKYVAHSLVTLQKVTFIASHSSRAV
jgi:hypothetical protein